LHRVASTQRGGGWGRVDIIHMANTGRKWLHEGGRGMGWPRNRKEYMDRNMDWERVGGWVAGSTY